MPQDIRWSPGLKQCEENLDNADYCRFILLTVKDIIQQLLHCLLPEKNRHEDKEKADKVTCGISTLSDLNKFKTISSLYSLVAIKHQDKVKQNSTVKYIY